MRKIKTRADVYIHNEQIEKMSKEGKFVYVTNDNFDYIKEKCKEHAISESDLINIAIEFFKNYDNEILKLISIYGFKETLENIIEISEL